MWRLEAAQEHQEEQEPVVSRQLIPALHVTVYEFTTYLNRLNPESPTFSKTYVIQGNRSKEP